MLEGGADLLEIERILKFLLPLNHLGIFDLELVKLLSLLRLECHIDGSSYPRLLSRASRNDRLATRVDHASISATLHQGHN